jgi:microsomal dipeptidase-like Zn-dependent dipeptidase
VLIDLHAHYPMQVIGDVFPDTLLREARRAGGRPGLRDKLRALVLRIASTFFSNRNAFSGYRISIEGMRASDVGMAVSVLTRPFDEAALGRPFGSAPESSYFQGVLDDLEAVEKAVAKQPRETIRFVHNRAQLEQALAGGATALVHALEGGFSLGETVEEVEANVAELARRGVLYITLAHLLPRQVATSCNAFPFLDDGKYRRLFRQREGDGLTERGIAALRAMVREGVLLDIAHMRQDALDETFRLLDEQLDPGCAFPVLATHIGYRFGKQEYMLSEATIRQIERRNGLIGLIMAQYQLNDGLRRRATETWDDTRAVVRRHIDKIASITGGYEHIAIGTDFDGFIKPTLTGLDGMGDLGRLTELLEQEYGDGAALMMSGNALRVLRQAWPAAGR